MKCIKCNTVMSGAVKALDINIQGNILHVVCCAKCEAHVEIAINTAVALSVETDKPFNVLNRIVCTIGGNSFTPVIIQGRNIL